jgi:GrpB-like predicted nucleotidyltransferase (UPF0157 family)
MATLTFVLSDTVAEEAAAAFAEHERRIRERLPYVEVRHTGGTSVPGVLTSGDVDLHVRAEKQTFVSARDVLCELYEPLYPDAWHDESAYFFAGRLEAAGRGRADRDWNPGRPPPRPGLVANRGRSRANQALQRLEAGSRGRLTG